MSESESKNMPLYKKWWFWGIVVVAVVAVILVIGSNKNTSVEKQEMSYSYEEGTPERTIEEIAKARIDEKYDETTIDRITINEDGGTDEEGDYIVLAYLKWDRKNKEDMTKEMLRMYCDDFAGTLAEKAPNVSEVAMFWEVPYHGDKGTSKCSYERKNNEMYLTDKTGLIGDK